jgi:predicted AlkP superfamily pyrophosphatase or phosphodiesterase
MEELRADGIPVDRHGTWVSEASGGVQRDWLYTRLAAHLFEHHPPNLIMIHLIEVDHVQHKFGPRTPEAYWAVSHADDRVRDIVEAAGRSEFGEKITFIVASDHGFFPIETDIRPNVLLRQAGYITIEGDTVTDKAAWCVAQGGGCMVYVLDEDRREEIVADLAGRFSQVEGVVAVLTKEEFDEIGQPTPEEDSRAPDLWLSAASGYSFTESHTEDEIVAPRPTPGGTHGYLPDQPDMWATLVMSGEGIREGINIGRAQNVDVAPTIARLLGVELPSASGEVIEEALV